MEKSAEKLENLSQKEEKQIEEEEEEEKGRKIISIALVKVLLL